MSSTKFPVFHTERLILNKIQPEDQKNIFAGLSHPEVIKYYGINFDSFKETEEQMAWYENLEKSGSGKWWAIRLNESGEFCGAVGYNDLVEQHKKAELGFWLLPDYWGEGIIKEASLRIINYIFRDLKLHRLEAYVETENANSGKVLIKLGFKNEGCMRECEIKNGRYISVDIYSILNK